jgi:hypothetical protein
VSRGLGFLAALAAGLVSVGWNPMTYRAAPPLRWSSGAPVVWNPDGGPLGTLTAVDAAERAAEAFAKWQEVPTATIAFAQGVPIRDAQGVAVDVTAANYAEILGLDNGQNPIIYDNDRQIFAAIGVPPSVLGFAGALRTSESQITKGYAVLQGDFIDGDSGDGRETTVEVFVGIMVHEFGHFLGLGHASVNLGPLRDAGLGACPQPTLDQFETMMPFAHNDMATLHHDDAIGVSVLYPDPAFGPTHARLEGRVLARDGSTPFDGANVILRRDATDCKPRYDEAQATQSGVNPVETGGAGTFRFDGLVPGASYTLHLATLDEGGSYPIADGSAGPPRLGGPDEYYNGAGEASFDPPDPPADVTPIVAGPGGTAVSGIDLRINNPGFPGAFPASGAASLRVSKVSSGTLELTWGDPCNAPAVPDQDTAVYQGTLASLGTGPDHAPIACGTSGERRWLVPGSSAPGDVFWLVAPLLADREGDLGVPAFLTCAPVEPGACP